jgi:radical SAM/Cys-rich protein
MPNLFEETIQAIEPDGLRCFEINLAQVNLGFLCNQVCRHCHVDASPFNRNVMDKATMALFLKALDRLEGVATVDLTGGAPELNPNFKWFVQELSQRGRAIQVRTNLTVLVEPGMEETPMFLKAHRVNLVASLPCYLEDNVNSQRGEQVFEKSIQALKRLNALGYGKAPGYRLNLVYNPQGPFLPPLQAQLEEDYKRELKARYDVWFNQLIAIVNMPIGRFLKRLKAEQRDADYMATLQASFNPATLDSLMCRSQISVGWDGRLYDCDFNLALGLPIYHGIPNHIGDFNAQSLVNRKIVTGNHCFGCAAGLGSSCQGVLL